MAERAVDSYIAEFKRHDEKVKALMTLEDEIANRFNPALYPFAPLVLDYIDHLGRGLVEAVTLD